MNEPPPAKHPLLRLLRKPLFWALALFLAVCGYQAWRVHDYRAAVDEAKRLGFEWEAEETFDLIRRDWRAALLKETRGPHERVLRIEPSLDPRGVFDLGRYRDLIHRLRPTQLFFSGSQLSGNKYDSSNWLQSCGDKVLKSCFASNSWRGIFSKG